MGRMQFIWDKNWAHNFETPLTIIGKFNYANQITFKDFFTVFGTVDVTQKRFNNYSSNEKSLSNITSIEEENVEDAIGINIVEYNQKMINLVAKVGLNGLQMEDTLRKRITYCPKCREDSYHSYFHQLHHFTHCPFHPEVELEDICPICGGKTNKYELGLEGGLLCKCGTSFFVERRDSPLFFRWKKAPEIKSEDTLEWMRLKGTDFIGIDYFVLDLPRNLSKKKNEYSSSNIEKPSIAKLILSSLGKSDSSDLSAIEFSNYAKKSIQSTIDQLGLKRHLFNLCNNKKETVSKWYTVHAEGHSRCINEFSLEEKSYYCTYDLAHKLWLMESNGMLDNDRFTNKLMKFDDSLSYFQFPLQGHIIRILDELLNSKVYEHITASDTLTSFIVEIISEFLLKERYMQWQLAVKSNVKLGYSLPYNCSTNFLIKLPKDETNSVSFYSAKIENQLIDSCNRGHIHRELKANIRLSVSELVMDMIIEHNRSLDTQVI